MAPIPTINLVTAVFALFSGILAAAFGVAVMYARDRFFPVPAEGKVFDFAMQINRALAVLVAVIIALVVAQAQIGYSNARSKVWLEADLLHNVFANLNYYGTEEAEQISETLADYTKTIVDTEWKLLSQNRLSPVASDMFQTAYLRVLDMRAANPSQRWLRGQLLKDMTELRGLRHARYFQANDRLSFVFWIVVLVGYGLCCVTYSVGPVNRFNLVAIAAYSFFFGVVAYSIFAFEDPFDGHLAVSPRPFVLLYTEVMEPTLQRSANRIE